MVIDDVYDLHQLNLELAVVNLANAEEEFEESIRELKKVVEKWIP